MLHHRKPLFVRPEGIKGLADEFDGGSQLLIHSNSIEAPPMPEISPSLASGQRPLTIREFAKLGYEELRAMHKRGELPDEALGVAADGAQEYVGALADGDVASPNLAMMRVASLSNGCAHCPSQIRTPTELTINGRQLVKVWCGKPGQPNTTGPRRTCGCFVAMITVEAEPDGSLSQLVGWPMGNEVTLDQDDSGGETEQVVIPGAKPWVGSERCPQGLW